MEIEIYKYLNNDRLYLARFKRNNIYLHWNMPNLRNKIIAPTQFKLLEERVMKSMGWQWDKANPKITEEATLEIKGSIEEIKAYFKMLQILEN